MALLRCFLRAPAHGAAARKDFRGGGAVRQRVSPKHWRGNHAPRLPRLSCWDHACSTVQPSTRSRHPHEMPRRRCRPGAWRGARADGAAAAKRQFARAPPCRYAGTRARGDTCALRAMGHCARKVPGIAKARVPEHHRSSLGQPGVSLGFPEKLFSFFTTRT